MKNVKKPMTNTEISVEGGIMTISVDLNNYWEKGKISESGKMYTVASSHGFYSVEAKGYEDIRLSLNVGVNSKAYEKAVEAHTMSAKEVELSTELARKEKELDLLKSEYQDLRAIVYAMMAEKEAEKAEKETQKDESAPVEAPKKKSRKKKAE